MISNGHLLHWKQRCQGPAQRSPGWNQKRRGWMDAGEVLTHRDELSLQQKRPRCPGSRETAGEEGVCKSETQPWPHLRDAWAWPPCRAPQGSWQTISAAQERHKAAEPLAWTAFPQEHGHPGPMTSDPSHLPSTWLLPAPWNFCKRLWELSPK